MGDGKKKPSIHELSDRIGLRFSDLSAQRREILNRFMSEAYALGMEEGYQHGREAMVGEIRQLLGIKNG